MMTVPDGRLDWNIGRGVPGSGSPASFFCTISVGESGAAALEVAGGAVWVTAADGFVLFLEGFSALGSSSSTSLEEVVFDLEASAHAVDSVATSESTKRT